ncbi:hypothetical protein GP5015_287 [gamma proteobacterium HTCC5015]|nr:hypothetical protein GP5015_287 [gamma proteobacterium HTCC5015]
MQTPFLIVFLSTLFLFTSGCSSNTVIDPAEVNAVLKEVGQASREKKL